MVRLRKTRAEVEGRWREEYVAEEEERVKSWRREQRFNYVGGRVRAVDGPAKVTGRAIYTADVALPGMLVGRFLRCPYPHARILSIDTSHAERIPGVRAVYTHLNTPKIPWHTGMSYLMDTTLRYPGEEVAFVVAEDEAAAEDALDSIYVEYERLPHVVDPLEAMREEAPKIHEGGNVFGGGP
jgi:xanthine dehydrogenase molybdenum-binding subunit